MGGRRPAARFERATCDVRGLRIVAAPPQRFGEADERAGLVGAAREESMELLDRVCQAPLLQKRGGQVETREVVRVVREEHLLQEHDCRRLVARAEGLDRPAIGLGARGGTLQV